MQEKTNTSLSSFYRHINQLPLKNFIECITASDVTQLIISGLPEVKLLKEAWLTIQEQYNAAMGDNESKLYLNLYKEVLKLSLTIQQVNTIAETLKDFYVPEMAAELNALVRTSYPFDINDPDQYDKDLKRCVARSKAFVVKLGLKRSELEVMEMKIKGKVSEVVSREYFQNVLITLSDNSQYPVRDDITVHEFTERIKRLNHKFENMKKR